MRATCPTTLMSSLFLGSRNESRYRALLRCGLLGEICGLQEYDRDGRGCLVAPALSGSLLNHSLKPGHRSPDPRRHRRASPELLRRPNRRRSRNRQRRRSRKPNPRLRPRQQSQKQNQRPRRRWRSRKPNPRPRRRQQSQKQNQRPRQRRRSRKPNQRPAEAAEPKADPKAPQAAEPTTPPKPAEPTPGATTTVTTEQRIRIREAVIKTGNAPR